MALDAKITLKRLNVVKVVDSEDKAQALVAKGFKRVTQEDAKPTKGKKQSGQTPQNNNPGGGE